jgi:hypothetical protein
MQRLQTATAETIHRDGRASHRQTSEERDLPRSIERELARGQRNTENHIIHLRWIKFVARNQLAQATGSKIIAAHVAKPTLGWMRPAKRRANAIDNHSPA